MGSFLCKIWTFVLRVADAVIDGIGHVIKGLVSMLLDVVLEIWDATIGSGTVGGVVVGGLLIFGLAWLLLSAPKKDNDGGGTNYVYT